MVEGVSRDTEQCYLEIYDPRVDFRFNDISPAKRISPLRLLVLPGELLLPY